MINESYTHDSLSNPRTNPKMYMQTNPQTNNYGNYININQNNRNNTNAIDNIQFNNRLRSIDIKLAALENQRNNTVIAKSVKSNNLEFIIDNAKNTFEFRSNANYQSLAINPNDRSINHVNSINGIDFKQFITNITSTFGLSMIRDPNINNSIEINLDASVLAKYRTLSDRSYVYEITCTSEIPKDPEELDADGNPVMIEIETQQTITDKFALYTEVETMIANIRSQLSESINKLDTRIGTLEHTVNSITIRITNIENAINELNTTVNTKRDYNDLSYTTTVDSGIDSENGSVTKTDTIALKSDIDASITQLNENINESLKEYRKLDDLSTTYIKRVQKLDEDGNPLTDVDGNAIYEDVVANTQLAKEVYVNNLSNEINTLRNSIKQYNQTVSSDYRRYNDRSWKVTSTENNENNGNTENVNGTNTDVTNDDSFALTSEVNQLMDNVISNMDNAINSIDEEFGSITTNMNTINTNLTNSINNVINTLNATNSALGNYRTWDALNYGEDDALCLQSTLVNAVNSISDELSNLNSYISSVESKATRGDSGTSWFDWLSTAVQIGLDAADFIATKNALAALTAQLQAQITGLMKLHLADIARISAAINGYEISDAPDVGDAFDNIDEFSEVSEATEHVSGIQRCMQQFRDWIDNLRVNARMRTDLAYTRVIDMPLIPASTFSLRSVNETVDDELREYNDAQNAIDNEISECNVISREQITIEDKIALISEVDEKIQNAIADAQNAIVDGIDLSNYATVTHNHDTQYCARTQGRIRDGLIVSGSVTELREGADISRYAYINGNVEVYSRPITIHHAGLNSCGDLITYSDTTNANSYSSHNLVNNTRGLYMRSMNSAGFIRVDYNSKYLCIASVASDVNSIHPITINQYASGASNTNDYNQWNGNLVNSITLLDVNGNTNILKTLSVPKINLISRNTHNPNITNNYVLNMRTESMIKGIEDVSFSLGDCNGFAFMKYSVDGISKNTSNDISIDDYNQSALRRLRIGITNNGNESKTNSYTRNWIELIYGKNTSDSSFDVACNTNICGDLCVELKSIFGGLVEIYDNTSIDGSLTITNDITINGNIISDSLDTNIMNIARDIANVVAETRDNALHSEIVEFVDEVLSQHIQSVANVYARNDHNHDDRYIKSSNATLNGTLRVDGSIFISDSGTASRGLFMRTALNDSGWIRVYGSSNDVGYMEIATGDNGTEPIYIRQYANSKTTDDNYAQYYSGNASRTLTLLDSSGNTSIPQKLYVNSGIELNSGNLNINGNGSIYINSTDRNLKFLSAYASGASSNGNTVYMEFGYASSTGNSAYISYEHQCTICLGTHSNIYHALESTSTVMNINRVLNILYANDLAASKRTVNIFDGSNANSAFTSCVPFTIITRETNINTTQTIFFGSEIANNRCIYAHYDPINVYGAIGLYGNRNISFNATRTQIHNALFIGTSDATSDANNYTHGELRILNSNLANNGTVRMNIGKHMNTYNCAHIHYVHASNGSTQNAMYLGLYGSYDNVKIYGTRLVEISGTSSFYNGLCVTSSNAYVNNGETYISFGDKTDSSRLAYVSCRFSDKTDPYLGLGMMSSTALRLFRTRIVNEFYTTFNKSVSMLDKLSISKTLSVTNTSKDLYAIDVINGYLRVQSGNIEMNNGNLNITTGNINVYNGNTNITGNINVNGSESLIGNLSCKGDITLYADAASTRGLYMRNVNDAGWIRMIETTTDSGCLEIATSDNGNEPIYVRQYTGNAGTNDRSTWMNNCVNSLTLLNASGNTEIPNALYVYYGNQAYPSVNILNYNMSASVNQNYIVIGKNCSNNNCLYEVFRYNASNVSLSYGAFGIYGDAVDAIIFSRNDVKLNHNCVISGNANITGNIYVNGSIKCNYDILVLDNTSTEFHGNIDARNLLLRGGNYGSSSIIPQQIVIDASYCNLGTNSYKYAGMRLGESNTTGIAIKYVNKDGDVRCNIETNSGAVLAYFNLQGFHYRGSLYASVSNTITHYAPLTRYLDTCSNSQSTTRNDTSTDQLRSDMQELAIRSIGTPCFISKSGNTYHKRISETDNDKYEWIVTNSENAIEYYDDLSKSDAQNQSHQRSHQRSRMQDCINSVNLIDDEHNENVDEHNENVNDLWKRYIGVVYGFDLINASVDYATHGDYYISARNIDDLCIGNDVYWNPQDFSSVIVLDDDDVITNRIRKLFIGTITGFIENSDKTRIYACVMKS